MVFETIYNAVFFHTGPILNLLYLKIHTNLWSIKKNLTGWGKYYCSQKVKFTTLEMMVRENLFFITFNFWVSVGEKDIQEQNDKQ